MTSIVNTAALSDMDLAALAYQYEQNPSALFSKYVVASLRELQALRIEVERRRADDAVTEEAREAALRIVRWWEKEGPDQEPNDELIVARALLAKVKESGHAKG